MDSCSYILPPGFRFHPTDEELIIHYLKQKVSSSSNPLISIIADVNIYKFDPWELPDKALFGDKEWFFFSSRDRKYPNGIRPNRAAGCGYWKATGTDKPIITSVGSHCLGMKKSLVFYQDRPHKGLRTDWMMTEYRLLDAYFRPRNPKGSMRLDDWVLCRVHHKSKVHQQGKNYDRSPSCSPPFLLHGCLQGQEMIISNYTIQEGNEYQFPSNYPMPIPIECEEFDDRKLVQTESLEYTLSNVGNVFNYIDQRVFFIEDISDNESQFMSIPKERFDASASMNNDGDASVFVRGPRHR